MHLNLANKLSEITVNLVNFVYLSNIATKTNYKVF